MALSCRINKTEARLCFFHFFTQPREKDLINGRGGSRDPNDKSDTFQMTNPRYSNGTLRRKYRARFKAMGLPCGICNGKLGPIHYDEPSNSQHPLSFVIDEIKPISKYRQFGYDSPKAAAQDWNNLQPAHYCCNAAKSNKTPGQVLQFKKTIEADGEW